MALDDTFCSIKEEIMSSNIENKSRLQQQFDFIEEIDKEKLIGRQTYISDGIRKGK